MGWTIVELRFDYRQWQGSRETLVLTDPPIQWISGATSQEMRWMGINLDTAFNLVPRDRGVARRRRVVQPPKAAESKRGQNERFKLRKLDFCAQKF